MLSQELSPDVLSFHDRGQSSRLLGPSKGGREPADRVDPSGEQPAQRPDLGLFLTQSPQELPKHRSLDEASLGTPLPSEDDYLERREDETRALPTPFYDCDPPRTYRRLVARSHDSHPSRQETHQERNQSGFQASPPVFFR